MGPVQVRVPDWLGAAALWAGVASLVVLGAGVANRVLEREIAKTREIIAVLEDDLEYFGTASAEMARLGVRPLVQPGPAPSESILVILERAALQAGVRDAIVSLSAAPAEGGVVVFADVSFAAWMQWVQLVDRTGLSLRSTTLDAGLPGRVSGQAVWGFGD
jgi:hypothetical protein